MSGAGAILLLGFGIGFLGSVPPAGPGMLLQIRRGLQRRRAAGMAIALGGTTADAIYCTIAVWGLGYLLDRYPVLLGGFRWGGLVVLVALGLVLLFRTPNRFDRDPADPQPGLLARDMALGFTVTASNPSVLITWSTVIGIIAAFEYVDIDIEGHARFTFPLGVAVGHLTWSLILLNLLHRFGHRLSAKVIGFLIRAAGLALVSIAVFWATKLAQG